MKIISIIIPTFNRKNYLKKLLTNLHSCTIPTDFAINIIVVVDGSTDGTFQMLISEFPEIHIVRGNGNWWYTKSMNRGFKKAIELNSDFVLTMNDDTEIENDYIINIIESYNKVEPGSIMGSVSFTMEKPNRILSSGSYYKSRILGITKSYYPSLLPKEPSEINDDIKESVLLPGRGMLIPIETLRELNLFDDKFKQYHSDSDFCIRAQNNNIKVYVSFCAHIFVHHKQTGKGTSFLKEPFFKYLQNYFDETSRLFIPSIALYNWRNGTFFIWPFKMGMFFLSSLRNFYRKSVKK
jgi:GT2 family glycosyltransferase